MTVTYEIEAEELNDNFLASLRSLFKGGRLKVTVEEETGIVSNPAMIEKLNEALAAPDAYVFKGEELSAFAGNVLTKGIGWLENYRQNEKH